MTKNTKNRDYLFALITVVVILSLTAFNLIKIPVKVKVLGVTEINNSEVFWADFLTKHPNYIPGLIETGKIDKVNIIDPNYF